MRPARAAAYLPGGILLAGWLASAAVVGRPSIPKVSPQSVEDAQLDAVASGVQAQASRLKQRLAAAPAPHTSTRNPFGFAERGAVVHQAPPPSRAPAPSVQIEPPLPEPDLALLGFADE